MTEFKNVKVPIQTHELMVLRAKALGMKKFVLADVLLQVGLRLSDSEIQQAVVNAQLKQRQDDTKPESLPEPIRPRASSDE